MYAVDETHRKGVRRTDAQGRFGFPAMSETSEVVLRVEHEEYAPFFRRGVLAEPLTIRLHGGCVVEGGAQPGDEVVLVGDDASRDTFADERGRFRFGRLPEGRYHLALRVRRKLPKSTRYAYPVVRPVEVRRGPPLDVPLTPLGTAVVRGSVEGTRDVEGAVVELGREGERLGTSVFVHERRFEISGVAAGRWRLGVEGGAPLELEIVEGETREVTLRTGD
jgi:hypothetical protein